MEGGAGSGEQRARDGGCGAGPAGTPCPVSSHNEWDPLEEVIVGRLEGARVPPYHISVSYNLPPTPAKLSRFVGGRRYPRLLTKPAQRELDEFIHILRAEGVIVRRPELMNFGHRVATPHWKSTGFCIACPRDGFLVVGDEIIETPMSWRSRHFEPLAYRALFQEYFQGGARWTAAPRPALRDSLFESHYRRPGPDEPVRYVINESELVFDAADFVRCGRDLFVTKSNVTNTLGIEWVRRHLGHGYRVHEVESRCRNPMHIDSSFMPLAPGKVMVNPDYIDTTRLPAVLRSWDVLVAPYPDPTPRWWSLFSMSSAWINMNVLMLDDKRVIVEKSQTSMIRALSDWGFTPIGCPFTNFAPFGGSFHCATLDVRRRGCLQSYF